MFKRVMNRKLGLLAAGTVLWSACSGDDDGPKAVVSSADGGTGVPGTTEQARKLIDTHIHLWTLPRADGATFPPMAVPWLSRDFMPTDYAMLPVAKNIESIVLVESCVAVPADKILDCNKWMLDVPRQEPKVKAVVGALDLTAADFATKLDALAADRRFAGIRAGGLVDRMTTQLKPNVAANLRLLSGRGLVLDTQMNAADVILTVDAAPDLKVVINHLGDKDKGKQGFAVEPAYQRQLELLAVHKNVHMKVSDIQRLGEADAMAPWPMQYRASADPAKYEAILEALWQTLGEDRLIFGSNWPVCNVAGTVDEQAQILEAFLMKKSAVARNKVMRDNAVRVYRIQ